MVHIHIHPVQNTPLRLDISLSPGDLRPHRRKDIGKAHISLQRTAADPVDPDLPPFDRGRSQEIGRRGSISFNKESPRTPIVLTALDDKGSKVPVFHLHTEGGHDLQSDIDIGFGDQISFDRHGTIGFCKRRGHQKGGQKLAGDTAIDGHHAAGKPISLDLQRWISVSFQIVDMGACLPQGIHQITDRPLLHARLSRQDILAFAKTKGRAQRPHRSPGIAEIEFRLPAPPERST